MSEAIASQLSAGAGRQIDLRWPTTAQIRQNSINVPAQIYNRVGVADAQVASISYNANFNFGWLANTLGRSGAYIGATVAGSPNGGQWVFHPMVVHIGKRAQGISPPILAGLDQLGAYRVMMIANNFTATAPLAANVDKGLELCLAGGATIDDGQICRLGTPGLGFRLNDANAVEAIIRPLQGGVLQRVDVTPPNYFGSDWHCYELRIIGARGAAAEAVARWYVDGQLMFSQSWGPGNVMPEIATPGGNIYEGFKTMLVTTGGSGEAFVVDQLAYHGARDELNLL